MSGLLVDTHVWLWLFTNPERIPRSVRQRLDDGELYLSVASIFEIAVKYRLGKLALPQSPAIHVAQRLHEENVQALPIAVEHALSAADLPPHHHDPFDRLIIAQALGETLTLVTGDEKMRAYKVPLLWAGRRR